MLLKEEIDKGMTPFQGFWGGKLISEFWFQEQRGFSQALN